MKQSQIKKKSKRFSRDFMGSEQSAKIKYKNRQKLLKFKKYSTKVMFIISMSTEILQYCKLYRPVFFSLCAVKLLRILQFTRLLKN
jgi:hypothetical protein